MTPTKRTVRNDLEDIKSELTDDGSIQNVVVTDAPECTMLTHTPDDDASIDSWQEPAIPFYLPQKWCGVVVLTGDELRTLWETMPAETKQRELEYRKEHDEPIPPLLDADS